MPKHPSLEVQCEHIGWPLQVMHARYLGDRRWDDGEISDVRAEDVVAARIAAEGHLCTWCEGGSINLLMKAAALDVLANRNFFSHRTDAIRRYLEAQFTILKEFESDLLACIRNVSAGRLSENIAEICADPFIREAYPRVRQDFLISLSSVLETEFLSQVATIFIAKPYEYRSGWPDLTVIDNRAVSFVEVKTTDRFHGSQLRFAEEVAKPLGLACRTVQLKACA